MSATVKSTPRKPYKGMAMEGVSRPGMPTTPKVTSRGYRACAQSVVDRLAPGSSVLEVAPGPGYLAIEIAKRGNFRVTGLDISHSFIRIASENAQREGVAIEFRQGDAAHMPFPDE